MEKRNLGNSGLTVSRLAFGCLCMGYLQSNLSVKEGGELIISAIESGINFFDTAQFYRTYEHIAYAVKNGYKDLILCSKSYAYDKRSAQHALEEALQMTGKDAIDVFMLHETESIHTIKGHWEALSYYQKMKQKGYIRAVGISTHYASAVKSAAMVPEIDVIETIINKDGLGVADGGREDMLCAVKRAKAMDKGIIAMKVLGGGNLYARAKECFDYAMKLDCVDTILCGMAAKEEIDANVAYFEGRDYLSAFDALSKTEKRLLIEDWCVGCGECVKRCANTALLIKDAHAVCDDKKCIRCGYCSSVCPELALKLITK